MKHQTNIRAEADRQELFITREFDAPRDLVFKAFTNPKLYSQWMLPAEHHMRVDYMHYKTGGSYRFIMPGANGTEAGLFGVVHELTAPERIIRTFEYEGLPEKGHLALEKTLFEALPGERTKVTVHFICESVAYRDGLVNSGMEAHTSGCHDRLAELLAQGIMK